MMPLKAVIHAFDAGLAAIGIKQETVNAHVEFSRAEPMTRLGTAEAAAS
jgi:hypothetical protein